MGTVPLQISLILASLCIGGIQVIAQDSSRSVSPDPAQTTPQSEGTITAVPNRPTFSTTAETVQTGVFEIEYGLEAAAGHQNINGLLKFGLVKNLELRFANNPFERDTGLSALGDSGVGLKYRFLREGGALPTMSILYNATLPTAGTGLGADGLGHAAGVLLSKDFGKHHLDFNEIAEWRGRSHAGGFDRDYFTALAYSRALTDRLGIAAEVAGFSRVNAATPSTLTVLQALTYNFSSRLVLDGGCYFAARGDLPIVTFFAGVTYSVADLSRLLRFAHH
jgi:Putative MetA-pathway of phenol degradation